MGYLEGVQICTRFEDILRGCTGAADLGKDGILESIRHEEIVRLRSLMPCVFGMRVGVGIKKRLDGPATDDVMTEVDRALRA